jgi:hypothetical protein
LSTSLPPPQLMRVKEIKRAHKTKMNFLNIFFSFLFTHRRFVNAFMFYIKIIPPFKCPVKLNYNIFVRTSLLLFFATKRA